MIKIPLITKDFEKFDFTKFDSAQGYSTYLLDDGTNVEYYKEADEYVYIEMPKDSYFALRKVYYSDGNIKVKGLAINSGGVKKGIYYFFNESGTLIKEEDYDRPYTFTFEDLLAYMEREKIPVTKGYIASGIHTKIFQENDTNGYRWKIRWLQNTSEIPLMMEEILIDGKTGKLISRRSYEYSHYPSR